MKAGRKPRRAWHGGPRWPLGVRLGLLANVVGLCAGAVFLTAPPGGRFRGMEPQAIAFVVLSLAAAALGLLLALPTSLFDLFGRRDRFLGSIGLLLAVTPFVVAQLVAEFVALVMNHTFD